MYYSDFEKFASKDKGINPTTLWGYQATVNDYVNPTIVENRPLNVAQMDVFSRLMMDRIIFLGTGINDDVANIITAQLLFLSSIDPAADVKIKQFYWLPDQYINGQSFVCPLAPQ